MRNIQIVYFARAGDTNRVKIGTTASIRKRIQSLQTGCPDQLDIIFTTPGDKNSEKNFHRMFKKSRISGEWFRYKPQIYSFLKQREERLEKEAEEYWEQQYDKWEQEQQDAEENG